MDVPQDSDDEINRKDAKQVNHLWLLSHDFKFKCEGDFWSHEFTTEEVELIDADRGHVSPEMDQTLPLSVK